MTDSTTLSYEVQARRDPRLWAMLATGVAMLGALFAARALNDGPLHTGAGVWVWLALALGAMLLVWTAIRRMSAGTSRGVRFDAATETFHWWNGRDPDARGSIPARRIGRIVVDASGDTLQIRIHDIDGTEVTGFREWCLPPSYGAWIAAVQTRFPAVDVVPALRRDRSSLA